MRWLCLLSLLAPLWAQDLPARIEAILGSSPAIRRAVWGIEVVSAASGEVLYESNRDRFFIPASNTKLFTTAFGLTRLGPDYRFQTSIRAEAAADASGRLAGDLRLVGGGDPTLSVRALDALAGEVAARGIRRIDGDIVGDDTAYVWEPYPEGWAVEDAVSNDGAPVSALTINDNVVSLTLRAAGRGRPPRLTLSPGLEFYVIDNRVEAGPGLENKVRVERLPGSRQVRLWGTLPSGRAGETRLLLAIDDPALFAAAALADALTGRGIVISGRPVALHRFANQGGPAPPPPVIFAARASPPLVEVLRNIDKVSQNLHAELVLREAGIAERDRFLKDAGLEENSWNLTDGSGLSRLNLVTPGAVVALLRYMYASPNRDTWISLLPVGGEDGTLAARFSGNPAAKYIHAKTGSLNHVAALSGYADSRSRGTLAFSILVNNFNAADAEIRAAIDRVALLLTE